MYMALQIKRLLGVAVLLLPGLFCALLPDRAGGGWAVKPFVGLGTDGGIQHIPLVQAYFVRSYLAGVAVSSELATFLEHLTLEGELQGVQHFGKQGNSEFNALFGLRWRLPWPENLLVGLAVGEGVSYATHIPAIERERGTTYSRILNYIYYELELGLNRSHPWSLVKRIHHRSGVSGLYCGASKGSNFVTLGLRYRNRP